MRRLWGLPVKEWDAPLAIVRRLETDGQSSDVCRWELDSCESVYIMYVCVREHG